MASGTFPALEETPAKRFVDEKSLTATRSRTAIEIEGLLVENEHLFVELLQAFPDVVCRHTQSWGVASFEGERQAPELIGRSGLLAFPGASLEGGDTLGEDTSRPRFRIKATYCGTVFHLDAVLTEDGQIQWDWKSMEALNEIVRKECLKYLLTCVRELIESSIPELLGKVRG